MSYKERVSRKSSKITLERVRERLCYDPTTGILTWKPRDFGEFENEGFAKRWNTRYANTQAGSKGSGGYIRVIIDYENFLAHRLCFLHYFGRWPEGTLDHINMVRDDNRIENLREATHSENLLNTKMRNSNKVGYKGVREKNDYNRKKKFTAQIQYEGKQVYLGYYETAEEAHEAYLEAANYYYGEYSHPNP